MPDKSKCIGCRDNFYNGNNPMGVKDAKPMTTGRNKGRGPNLQSFPVRTPEGKAIREALIPILTIRSDRFVFPVINVDNNVTREAARLGLTTVVTKPTRAPIPLYEFWLPCRGRIVQRLTYREAEAWLMGYRAARGDYTL